FKDGDYLEQTPIKPQDKADQKWSAFSFVLILANSLSITLPIAVPRHRHRYQVQLPQLPQESQNGGLNQRFRGRGYQLRSQIIPQG
ncbi:MAG: hypothetical protein VB088_10645, partial [Sphaerochaeta sp.]|nr:hypothetical protein [Sphaerochaeta sp.]